MADTRPEQRIAKLLARAGVASRREVERMIAEGRIALDGAPVETPATLLRSLRGVTVDGNPVAAPPPAQLFLFHKPNGVLVTERDPAGRPTIYARLPSDLPRLVPVGRLDLNTEGLLLLTTDGGLKRQLELPANGVERAYRARAFGEVSQAQLEELIEGVEIDGVRYGPIDANLERRTGANTWVEMILTEGKNREVRRVLEHLGLQVSRLIRTRYGPFVLGDLQPSEIGEVRQHDLVAFRRMLEKKQRPEQAVAVEARTPNPPRARIGEGDRSAKPSGGGTVAKRAAGSGQRASQRSRPRNPSSNEQVSSVKEGIRRDRPSTTRASAGGPPPRASSGRIKKDRPGEEQPHTGKPKPQRRGAGVSEAAPTRTPRSRRASDRPARPPRPGGDRPRPGKR